MSRKHYEADQVTVWHGDCIEVMRTFPDASVDAVVTDPPYGLNFMGKDWDHGGKMLGQISANWSEKATHSRGYADNDNAAFGEWCRLWARETYRLLKPGGHLLAFGGTRTFHRLAVGIEDAGFDLRDSIAWLYGSGFPKSLDVSKAIDKAAGAEREVVGKRTGRAASPRTDMRGGNYANPDAARHLDLSAITAPATDDAAHWQGWGTALKPAFEPVVVARKPLAGTVAANVLAHGTGALNIDASRIPMSDADATAIENMGGFGQGGYIRQKTAETFMQGTPEATRSKAHAAGRWPSNVLLDESQAEALDAQTGTLASGLMRAGQPRQGKPSGILGEFKPDEVRNTTYGDTGGASRFFYTAKASTDERPSVDGIAHPTVKPLDLMRWLVRLVTPKGGTVLEPFAGSGTTVEAAVLEGFRCIAIEREADYLPLIMQRIGKPHAVGLDFDWEDAS